MLLNPTGAESRSFYQWSTLVRVYIVLDRHGCGLNGWVDSYEASQIDSKGSANLQHTSTTQDVKKKSPDVLVLENLNKLAFSLHSFYATLVKGFTSQKRRRAESGSMNSASKNLATTLSKIFHEALSFSKHSTSV
uniref:Uncharacterized protein n=1 Tax=Nelumbo nucifera TaxID=4432 RepID=A0A822Z7I1_NELNU|nr:TPA_asm: hypothetical protein HUJ06_013964 [Nelumbo nucifera]